MTDLPPDQDALERAQTAYAKWAASMTAFEELKAQKEPKDDPYERLLEAQRRRKSIGIVSSD